MVNSWTDSGALLCVHGHFYQPPREDPFTGETPAEPQAAPFHNFNEKITSECYRPNARLGNFERISFDLGPTLASWLERHDPETYRVIIAADRANAARSGRGNAIAQAYNHTILPLATHQEKRLQIAWGIADFTHRFGRPPEGMWLPETAVDLDTLDLLAEFGIRFTILAPWQVTARDTDLGEPYRVKLRSGRSIAAFVYHGQLSADVSFDSPTTTDAVAFAEETLRRHLESQKPVKARPQLLHIATDGELYGHHQVYRDLFLAHLTRVSGPAAGFELIWPAEFLARYPLRRDAAIREGTSWSCAHGIERWRADCACTEGDGGWKWHLRHALDRLGAKLDMTFELESRAVLREPWQALEAYLGVRLGDLDERQLLARFGKGRPSRGVVRNLRLLLEAQYFRHLMFASCAFFFEDLDRLEPAIAIANGVRAARLVRRATGLDLEKDLALDLRGARSWRTGRTGADLYRQVLRRSRWRAREHAGGSDPRHLDSHGGSAEAIRVAS